MDLEEELQLVEKSKENVQAFDAIYRYYLPKIYGYCFNRLPNKEQVEEIVSDVFVDSLNQLNKFQVRENARFGSLLYKIAHNKLVDCIRKSKRNFCVEIKDDAVDDSVEHDYSVECIERQKKVAHILSLIHPRYQEIISLKYYSELSNSEISEIVGSTNISLLLHRAHAAFKSKFEKFYPKSEIFDLI